MKIEELLTKIHDFNFDFIKHINPETKELSNKVLLLSCIIIFLNFNYLSISEIEISGLKIITKGKILLIILFFINTYYFFQFNNSIRIDFLLAKIPQEYTTIAEAIKEKLENQTIEIQNITKKFQECIDDKNFDIEAKNILSKNIEDITNDQNIKKLQHWIKSSESSIRYYTWNKRLNHNFPFFCYLISILSFLIFINY